MVVIFAALVVGALICADVGLVDGLLVLVRLARRVVAIEERLVASEVVAPPAALVAVRRVKPAVAVLLAVKPASCSPYLRHRQCTQCKEGAVVRGGQAGGELGWHARHERGACGGYGGT